MEFQVLQQGDIVAKQAGKYTSFPSLARDPKTGEILVLYRQATYDESDERRGMKAHGLDGSLFIKRFNPCQKSFSPETLILSGKDYPPGFIDGILTTLDDTIYMFARCYPEPFSIYYATGPSIAELSKFRLFPRDKAYPLRAEWGKVTRLSNGSDLLQVIYNAIPREKKIEEGKTLRYYSFCPSIYRSKDEGKSWKFSRWIAPRFLEPGISANETCILNAEGKIYALMRTGGVYPGPMFLNYSTDNGKTWSPPQNTGLYGEAPVFYTMSSGKILVCYRGFLSDSLEAGGTFTLCEFFPKKGYFSKPFVVETYKGNHYDGGYGDMLWIDELNQLLVVYYYSDQEESRNPWLRYALLSVV